MGTTAMDFTMKTGVKAFGRGFYQNVHLVPSKSNRYIIGFWSFICN